jgi:formate-nitrite transporter family protein
MTRARLTPPVSDRDHIQGPLDAPVTLVEYGDYECPHCGRAYPIVKAAQRQLGDRLRFVFRNFPLAEAHPHARRAAEAAEAAAAQGRFWRMHDMLFEHQHALEDAALLHYAEILQLDTERFARELRDGTYAQRVSDDVLGGARSGVNGTPTFFVNGVRYDGIWSPADQFIRELAASSSGGTPLTADV